MSDPGNTDDGSNFQVGWLPGFEEGMEVDIGDGQLGIITEVDQQAGTITVERADSE